MNHQVSQKKAPTFENSYHKEYITNFDDSNCRSKPKDRSISVIFVAVLPALGLSVNSSLLNFIHDCKMTEEGPKSLIKS